MMLVESERVRHHGRASAMIAGQHRDAADAIGAQQFDRFARGLANRIGNRDRSRDLVVDRDEQRRHAGLRTLFVVARHDNPASGEHGGIANHHRAPQHVRFRAHARRSRESDRRGNVRMLPAGVRRDGPRNRMFRS
jgi:hypothetical protein